MERVIMSRIPRSKPVTIKVDAWFISIFSMLFWSYHYTALEILHISSTMILGIELLAVIIPMILTARLEVAYITPLLFWQIFWCATMFNNYYVQSSSYSRPVAFLLVLLLAYGLQFSDQWYRAIIKCVLFFSWEHFILGWLFLLCSPLYRSLIVPLFARDLRPRLLEYHNSRIIVGLCEHYSTSGVYFALACIACFSIWLYDRMNVKKIVALLLMVISLLMTQKRGPLAFMFLSLFLVFLTVNKINAKLVVRGIIALFALVICFLILAQQFPELAIVFERFHMDSGSDLLNGRGELYELALNMFRENPVMGSGWGQYRMYTRLHMGKGLNSTVEFSAHNIYLQVFAEIGIVGGIAFVILLMGGVLITRFVLKKHVAHHAEEKEEGIALCFSLGMQLFFILYGISGNPIYDPQCFIPYFMSLAIPFSVSFRYRHRIEKRRWRGEKPKKL